MPITGHPYWLPGTLGVWPFPGPADHSQQGRRRPRHWGDSLPVRYIHVTVAPPRIGPAAQQEELQRPVPPAPKTFYVIRGCYAGDRPPDPTLLPKDCDIGQVREVSPATGGGR